MLCLCSTSHAFICNISYDTVQPLLRILLTYTRHFFVDLQEIACFRPAKSASRKICVYLLVFNFHQSCTNFSLTENCLSTAVSTLFSNHNHFQLEAHIIVFIFTHNQKEMLSTLMYCCQTNCAVQLAQKDASLTVSHDVNVSLSDKLYSLASVGRYILMYTENSKLLAHNWMRDKCVSICNW